jgi:hypothetical protein
VGQPELKFSESDLRQWNLLEEFRKALEKRSLQSAHPSFANPNRKLRLSQYLSLYLFGLLNPAIGTMRGLCAASALTRVQREVIGGPQVSQASFSDAQHLVDPALLETVFNDLYGQLSNCAAANPQAVWQKWFARDSSVFAALPRMAWALYGGGDDGSPNRALRLHLNLHLLSDAPAKADITIGKCCERKSWQSQWEAGAGYVGDRYYSENFKLFGLLEKKGCAYVLRLNEKATIAVEEEIALTEADQKAGVARQAWVRLGTEAYRSVRVRLVWIEGKDCSLILVTNLPAQDLSAELVAMLYRKRWQIECFFRWVKCILGCRHFLAESQRGTAIQLYLALIAGVLLQLWLGRRPNKRMIELLQQHQAGWASTQELIEGLYREQRKEALRKKNLNQR